MKKVLSVAMVLCLAALVMVGCNPNSPEKTLKEAAKVADKLMAGKQADEITTVRSITYEDNAMVYRYDVQESDEFTVGDMEDLRFLLEPAQREAFESEPNFAKEVIPLLKRVDGSIKCIYYGAQTGEEFVMEFKFE